MTRSPTRPTSAASSPPARLQRPRWASPQRLIRGDLPPTYGPLVARWIERFLVHGEGDSLGQAVRLDPFQKYILRRKYEYDPATGHLLYDRVMIGMAKGNAKTELMAHDALVRLAGPVAPVSPNIPVAAASWAQANRLFGAARLALEEGPLAPLFRGHIAEDRITRPDGPGILSRIAAIAGTNDGGLPSDAYEDEVHEWADERRERVDVILGNSLQKRSPRAELPDGRVCVGGQQVRISTAGDDKDTLLGRLYEHGVRVASGEVVDPSYLFLWWEASQECDLDTEAGLLAAIAEANPAAGSFLSIENLAQRFHDPLMARYEWERYHGNRFVSAPEAWITLDRWTSRRETGGLIEPPAGTAVCLGFYGSMARNATALVGATIAGHVFLLKAWEQDPHNPDWVVPRDEVDEQVALAFARYRIGRLTINPGRWESETQAWAARYGAEIIIALDTFVAERFAPACAAFHDAVMEGTLSHDGSPLLARHIANARTRETRWGLVIGKEHKDSPRHIDAANAAVLAYAGVIAPTVKPVDRTLHTW